MDLTLIETGLQQGIWALLFISLYLHQLKENRRMLEDAKSREDKLIDFISGISKRYETLAHQFETLSMRHEKISEDINEMKTELHISTFKKG